MKCKYCKRELPDKSFQTKDGCVWCDADYRFNKMKEKKK